MILLKLFVPYRMVNLATRISHAFSQTYRNQFSLAIPDWRLLACLGEYERLTAKDIAELTLMDKSKVSRAVKQLADRSLLLREQDHNDNRAAYLSLTEQGWELYSQISPKALAWEEELLSVLDTTEYRNLMRIMEKLENQVIKMATHNPEKEQSNSH
ncbi:MarR family winged helix-turn-helix transcriptional regulator [Paraglaciecola polaris]|uniref:HTH marR-type domain-containing protein n=1 Tax=Paraglaciecola polaris LMG 21857 TaxID=1129793 RepID=K6ZAA7_9ALTE|nr:MarR family transcriptional regulator [Paraglaciecola polaris]GAC33071.1 hypothetical protein GPLA_2166 [Paraglaciecola polaris LMG 21857]